MSENLKQQRTPKEQYPTIRKKKKEIGNNFIQQQDNCSIYIAKTVKEWLCQVEIIT